MSLISECIPVSSGFQSSSLALIRKPQRITQASLWAQLPASSPNGMELKLALAPGDKYTQTDWRKTIKRGDFNELGTAQQTAAHLFLLHKREMWQTKLAVKPQWGSPDISPNYTTAAGNQRDQRTHWDRCTSTLALIKSFLLSQRKHGILYKHGVW